MPDEVYFLIPMSPLLSGLRANLCAKEGLLQQVLSILAACCSPKTLRLRKLSDLTG
jgi:hypothetical protein